MLPLLARIVSLLLGAGLALAGNGLLGTLLAVRLSDAGFGAVASGCVLSAYFAGFAAGTQGADRVIERVGHIRAFGAFVAILAVVTLAHGLLPPSWTWAVLRVLGGISMSGLFMTIESWLNATTSRHVRGQVLSMYMLSVYLGLGCGQLLLNAWPVDRLELFCLSAMLFSLAAVPVSLTRAVAPTLESPERLPVQQLWAVAPLGLAAVLAAGVLAACIYSLAPIYGRMIGLSSREVSFLMSGLIFGGLLFQWPLGRLSDRTDRRRVVLGVTLAIAATSAVLALQLTPTLASLYLPAVLFGGLVFALYPLGVAHTFDRLHSALTLQAASQLLLATAIGSAFGPVLASLVMALLGAPGLFVFAASVSLVLAAAILTRMSRVEAVPIAEQEPFVAVPRTTDAAVALDPRGQESAE